MTDSTLSLIEKLEGLKYKGPLNEAQEAENLAVDECIDIVHKHGSSSEIRDNDLLNAAIKNITTIAYHKDATQEIAARAGEAISYLTASPKPVMGSRKELEEVRQTLISVRNNIYICKLEYDQVEKCIAKLSAILEVENAN